MTNKEILEKFGQDYIDYCYNHTMKMFSQYLPRKASEVPSFTVEEMENVYAAVVHQSLADFLYLFDQKREEYSLVVHHADEKLDVVAESDGIIGELYGANGWLAKYSQSR